MPRDIFIFGGRYLAYLKIRQIRGTQAGYFGYPKYAGLIMLIGLCPGIIRGRLHTKIMCKKCNMTLFKIKHVMHSSANIDINRRS